ncbi:Uncharacterized protein SCF082_LOCUS42841 [Durusdinium trenchii]|uniref:Uncharacterized protein n=1 Tax=Durusdinium trenchii TaxID=1381693 RepID=A0ABP0QUS0_9DINO
MRFSRSLKSPRTPAEVKKAGAAAFRDSSMLQVLYEQWASCSGQWSQSDFYLQARQKRRFRTHGSRRWMTKLELQCKFGAQAAEDIIAAKTLDPEVARSHVRANPDLHGLDTDETRQYLTWDKECEETTVDEVTSKIFQAVDRDDGDESRGRSRDRKGKKSKKDHKDRKSKKKKQKKRSSSSISSSRSSSDSSKSSSSSSQKKKSKDNKRKKEKKDKKDKKGKKEKEEGKKEKEEEKKEETEEQKKKRLAKEEAEQKKQEEKRKEEERKAAEKVKNDAFKKELKKGTQALSKISAAIAKSTSLDDKLRNMSASVVTAILEEVKPHACALKKARSKLQKSVDDAKVDNLGTLQIDVDVADAKVSGFTQLLGAYNIKSSLAKFFTTMEANDRHLKRGSKGYAPGALYYSIS